MTSSASRLPPEQRPLASADSTRQNCQAVICFVQVPCAVHLPAYTPHVLTLLLRGQGNLSASSEAGVLGPAIGTGRAGKPDGFAAAAPHGGQLTPAASE